MSPIISAELERAVLLWNILATLAERVDALSLFYESETADYFVAAHADEVQAMDNREHVNVMRVGDSCIIRGYDEDGNWEERTAREWVWWESLHGRRGFVFGATIY